MPTQFVTKRLIIKEDSKDRFFEGILSVEIKDRQGEITDINELYKALPVWMERGAPMSDTHSNRIVGRGINFEKVTVKSKNGVVVPAIKIMGKIHNNTTLDDYIWKQIVDGKYRGLSFGGATKADRTPIVQSDGSIAYALKDLEIYEVAICEDPAVAFAVITDFNPMAKSIEKAYHLEKEGDKEIVVKCDGTECYVNADIMKANKADLGAEQRDQDKAKPSEVYIGKPVKEQKGDNPEPTEENIRESEESKKDFFGQDEKDFHTTDTEDSKELKKPEDKTKPLPTKYGKMEFQACEDHAKKDPSVHNPGGYCGSIQAHVEKAVPHMVDENGGRWYTEKDVYDLIKDTKVHAGQQEYSSTESCIDGEGHKDEIRDAESYCGSRHNDEHGINPNDDKHKGLHDTAQAAGTGTGIGNTCDAGSSCAGRHGKTWDERQGKEKQCNCGVQKDIVGGTENPRGLGAYNTAVNGTGQTQQITDPKSLGNPEKLESNPKKPKDPAAKSDFQKEVEKYWEENSTLDNNSALHLAIKDYIDNYKEEEIDMGSFFVRNMTIKAYMDSDEPEWVADLTKFSTSPEGIAQYGANIEVDARGNLVNEDGNIIFINPFIS